MSSIGDRFRSVLNDALGDMARDPDFANSMQGMMLRPMLPVLLPLVGRIPDHTCESVLAVIESKLSWIREGR